MSDSNTRGEGFESIFISAPDGLRLHVRSYGPQPSPKVPTANLPVVCLPGLTRTAADFHELALALGSHPQTPRRVLALDYRGRGQSGYDRNPRNYTVATELSDLLAVLAALNVGPAVYVGTSRGGILTMMLAIARPAAIAGVVLNDIGPVIEPAGIARIKSYVGKLPQPKNFEEGAEILRRLFGKHFPKFTAAEWLAWSRRSYRLDDRGTAGRTVFLGLLLGWLRVGLSKMGVNAPMPSPAMGSPKVVSGGSPLVPNYDVKLARTLRGIDLGRRMPPMWSAFDALGAAPLMVLRGANSDLLSEATLAAMRARRGEMESFVVPDQGHAPILAGAELIGRIAGFVLSCESRAMAA
jgi:pimeloyl-ACP methyl ester carboxylesterase